MELDDFITNPMAAPQPTQTAPQEPAPSEVAPDMHPVQTQRDNLFHYEIPDPDNPDVYRTTATTFGWQQGPGSDKEDNGEFAYGGGSTNNPENYIALPQRFVHNGVIQPGESITVRNPVTGASARGILRDKGGARGGIDLAPSLAEQLGIDGKGQVDIDFASVGSDDKATPGVVDSAAQYLNKNFAATNAPSAGVMSTDTAAPETPEPQGAEIKRYKDGTLDFGGGIMKYPNGVVELRTGQAVHQYIPDENSKSGYKLNTHYINKQNTQLPAIPDEMSPQEALKQLPAQDQIMAQMFASYELPATSQYGRMNPDFARLLPYVKKLNPNVDPFQYQLQRQTQMQFASQAPTAPGRAISAANQALKHLGLLYDIHNELGGSNFPNAQAMENYIKDHMGAKAVNDFRIVRTTLATEIARSLQQGVPTLDQIREWQKNIDEGLGNAQRRSALVRDIPGVLEGQLETYDQAWTKVMKTQYDKDKLIDPVTQKSLRKLGINKFADRDIGEDPDKVDKPADYTVGKVYPGTFGGKASTARFKGYDASGKPQWEPLQ